MQLSHPARGRSARSRWLARLFGFVLVLCAVPSPRPAHADDRARAAVTYFRESAANTPLNVIHPQVTYAQDYTEHFGLSLGYDADIVTGATPSIFGVDVVTSATEFDDIRHNGSLGLRFLTEYATLTVAGGFAGEKDYLSGTVSAGVSTDLYNRNTQIAIDYTHNFDRVCDAANAENQEILALQPLDSSDDCFGNSDLTQTRKLSIDSVQLAVTQVATPWLVFQLGATGQHLNGFQSNPYRAVLLGRRAVQEHVPTLRNRLALFGRAKLALKPIRGAIEMNVRGYFDSWAVESFTGQLSWDQYVARPLIVRVRARWHVQDSAVFYRDGNEYATGGPAGSYWTGDRELSALMNTTAGVKVTYLWRAQDRPALKVIDQFVVSGKADMMFYRSLTPNPTFSPNAERTQGLLDALVIQAQFGFDF